MDWVRWHERYTDRDGALSRRLSDVVSALTTALDTAQPGPIRVLSLCAGDARDISRALHEHRRASDVTGFVVELNDELASRARVNLDEFENRLVVLCADASDPTVWRELLPVDVLILVGIFGNIPDADIEQTITAVPALCSPGASIVWTRHRRAPDMTPLIASWFTRAGCESQSFASSGPSGYAVGAERYVHLRDGLTLPDRLFTFIDPQA
jgi:hypothetical protein